MKTKLLLSFLCVVMVITSATSQSIYHIRYSLPAANDTTTYRALFVLYNDGSGIVRVKYTSPSNREVVLKQMDVQEQYFDMNKVNASNDKLFYQLSNTKIIMGSEKQNTTPLFCFKKNTTTGEYEPWGVASSLNDVDKSISTFSDVQFIESKDLKEDFVLEYFTRTDDFYKNLFTVRTRALLPFEKSTKLFLLSVANVNDPTIGASCLKDMNRTIETFTNLTQFLGIKLEAKTIAGTGYNKANVQKEINALAPSPNDIVVFYYSGHGFRKPKDSRRFPYIDLRAKPDNSYMVNSLNVEDIYTSIKKKGARLNLVISDCCNTEVDASNAIGTPIPAKKALAISWSQSNCQALFLNPKPLSMLVTAADVGQKAASNNDFGGFFSYFFKTSMETQCSFFKINPTWDNILKDAKKQTIYKAEHTYCAKPYVPENICEQFPVWK
jgi:hypothetical protein